MSSSNLPPAREASKSAASMDSSPTEDSTSEPDGISGTIDRRRLLEHLVSIGAGALAVAMGGGAIATLTGNLGGEPAVAATGPTKRKFRYGMVIDTHRCVGCRSCVVACKAENKTPPGGANNTVLESAFGENRPFFATKPCFHCENPPCLEVCPVGATFKRPWDGIVVVDYDRCVGAQACVMACPYSARFMDTGKNYPAVAEKTAYAQVPSPEYGQFRKREPKRPPIGKARKCTFCLHLQDAEGRYDKASGRWPACAKTCVGKSIHFGDFMDPNSEVSVLLRERKAVRLQEELGTQPNVYYLI